MLNAFRARKSNILVWILMGMLIVGLAGFGIGVSGGLASRDVASVGGQAVTADAYARALDQELRAISARIGRALPMREARQFGIDRIVLSQLINDAALDTEAKARGLSSGDEVVRQSLMAAPAFQGIDGSFDREAYVRGLSRIGMTPEEFEEQLRREATRELLAISVERGSTLPAIAAGTVLGFLGERRGFDWIRLDGNQLETPVGDPTPEDLAELHEAEAARYTRPATRMITYAAITPEALAGTIEIPEDELRAAYDAAPERFSTPERRILDRIGFRTAEEAADAKRRLDAGEIGFDALAEDRGLTAGDTDQGTVAAADLSETAGEVVFGAPGPGIVGPVDTPLGPSLYRINAILDATVTPFEEARTELAETRALEEAQSRILDDLAAIEDLIAGGATIEEVAAETVLEAGSIALNDATTGGLADDPGFRTLAADAVVGEETDLADLEDGGLVTLRVDAIEEPALIPLDEIRDRVAEDWRADRIAEALTERADALIAELEGGTLLADIADRLDVPLLTAAPMTRGEVVPDAPPRLVADIFEAEPAAAVTLRDGAGVILAHLTDIEAFDAGTDEGAELLAGLQAQFDQQAGQDVLALYTGALRDAAGVTVNQQLIEATLSQFP